MWGTREIGYCGRFPKAVVPQIRSILELSLLTILLEWWCFSEEDCTCSLLPATQTSGAAGRSHERSWAESVKELARSIHVELKTTITFMRWFQPTCRFPETSSELLLYLCFQLLQVRKKIQPSRVQRKGGEHTNSLQCMHPSSSYVISRTWKRWAVVRMIYCTCIQKFPVRAMKKINEAWRSRVFMNAGDRNDRPSTIICVNNTLKSSALYFF